MGSTGLQMLEVRRTALVNILVRDQLDAHDFRRHEDVGHAGGVGYGNLKFGSLGKIFAKGEADAAARDVFDAHNFFQVMLLVTNTGPQIARDPMIPALIPGARL